MVIISNLRDHQSLEGQRRLLRKVWDLEKDREIYTVFPIGEAKQTKKSKKFFQVQKSPILVLKIFRKGDSRAPLEFYPSFSL